MCCGSAFPVRSGSKSSYSLACVGFCHFPHSDGNVDRVYGILNAFSIGFDVIFNNILTGRQTTV